VPSPQPVSTYYAGMGLVSIEYEGDPCGPPMVERCRASAGGAGRSILAPNGVISSRHWCVVLCVNIGLPLYSMRTSLACAYGHSDRRLLLYGTRAWTFNCLPRTLVGWLYILYVAMVSTVLFTFQVFHCCGIGGLIISLQTKLYLLVSFS
jgi:hypothetical protein